MKHYLYLKDCGAYSGKPDLETDICREQSSGDCQDLVEEDCRMLGNTLFHTEAASDSECSKFSSQLNPPAAYFSWDGDTKECSAFDSTRRTCTSMSGTGQNLTAPCNKYIDDNSDCSSFTVGACHPKPSEILEELPGISEDTVCENFCKIYVS